MEYSTTENLDQQVGNVGANHAADDVDIVYHCLVSLIFCSILIGDIAIKKLKSGIHPSVVTDVQLSSLKK